MFFRLTLYMFSFIIWKILSVIKISIEYAILIFDSHPYITCTLASLKWLTIPQLSVNSISTSFANWWALFINESLKHWEFVHSWNFDDQEFRKWFHR
jgi:hypothetical protein